MIYYVIKIIRKVKGYNLLIQIEGRNFGVKKTWREFNLVDDIKNLIWQKIIL